jgi:hypothetical protein
MLAESLPLDPVLLSVYLHLLKNALLPRAFRRTHNFGAMLKPRWIVGTGRLDQ